MQNMKQDMMRLWKNVFGDSDGYIDLFFKNYYNEKLFDTVYSDDKLVSQLCCVPYVFKFLNNCDKHSYHKSTNSKLENIIKAGYLCGLATLPEYRNKGIMSSLIHKSNRDMRREGFAVSFLIPASKELRIYYDKFGYIDISNYWNTILDRNVFNNKEITIDYSRNNILYNITFGDTDKYVVVSINDCIRDIELRNLSPYSSNDVKELYDYFCKTVSHIEGCVLVHSYLDFITILRENYLNRGYVLCIKDEDNKPSGMLFCSNIREGEATVQLLIADSEDSAVVLLNTLKSMLPENVDLIVREYDGAVPRLFEQPSAACYANENSMTKEDEESSMTSGSLVRCRLPLAMARILNVSEILKFVAASYPRSEFSILIKSDEFPENEGFYTVRDSKVLFSPLECMSTHQLMEVERLCSHEHGYFQLTVPELSSILWRDFKEPLDGGLDLIPRLPLNVFLMLE